LLPSPTRETLITLPAERKRSLQLEILQEPLIQELLLTVEPVQAERALLLILLGRYACARLVGCDVWQCAPEWRALRPLGLRRQTVVDALRHGHALCRPELPVESGLADLRIDPETRLSLTELGVAQALQELATHPLSGTGAGNSAEEKRGVRRKPRWDRHARELYYGEILVLRFRRDAPNQMHILDAFQELRWAPRIDDPLPPHGGVDRRERLHDTVRHLNRGQIPVRIRFATEADGQGVRWTVVEERKT
jgi:hypothetical protein